MKSPVNHPNEAEIDDDCKSESSMDSDGSKTKTLNKLKNIEA